MNNVLLVFLISNITTSSSRFLYFKNTFYLTFIYYSSDPTVGSKYPFVLKSIGFTFYSSTEFLLLEMLGYLVGLMIEGFIRIMFLQSNKI